MTRVRMKEPYKNAKGLSVLCNLPLPTRRPNTIKSKA